MSVYESTSRPKFRDDRGGAAIECVGLLPLFLVAAIATLQIGLAGWASIETEHAPAMPPVPHPSARMRSRRRRRL